MERQTDMTFDELAQVLLVQHELWFKGHREWTATDWSNAAAGEMGETCNVVKKIMLYQDGLPVNNAPKYEELLNMLGEEIADTIMYLVFLAAYFDRHIPTDIENKFDKKSLQLGLRNFSQLSNLRTNGG